MVKNLQLNLTKAINLTLYSYCIPHDNGAAPNPFWDVCTLAICKPKIRSVAKIGDWVVGTGSKEFGFENQVVYAMKVVSRWGLRNNEFPNINK